MVYETIEIPATVSNGVSPFYFEWRVKRQSDSNWNSFDSSNQTYQLNSIDADTWVCYCIVTDKDGKRAQSNICTITVSPPPEQPTVSIPLAASCKAGQILNIPATVIYGTAPYTYTWMIKRNDASEWETSSKHGQSYTRTFVEATTWDCYCIVTDKNGNTAQSNICTIIVAER